MKICGEELCPGAFSPCGDGFLELINFLKEFVRQGWFLRKRNAGRHAWKSGKSIGLEVGKCL